MNSVSSPSPGFAGRRMTIIATIATNASIGLTIGGYGISMLAIQQEFATTRTLAALGLSLAMLTLGILPPLIANLQRRFSIRNTMVAGALIAAIGYLALSFTTSIWVLLGIYALLIGPSTVMFGQFASSVLMSNWYVEGRGRVLGIIGMPVLIMLVPIAAAPILATYGVRTLFLLFAIAHVVLAPILLLVIDRPEQIGQIPLGNHLDEPSPAAVSGTLSISYFTRQPSFWLMVVGIGILNGGGIAKASHLAAIAAEQGRTLDQAALLMAVAGGSGIVGSLAFGWIGDRLGGALTLVINALLQVLTWSILLFNPQMPMLLVDGFIMGSCGAGVYSLVALACSAKYGSANIGRSLAYVNAFSTPLLFIVSPMIGSIQDRTGSYWGAVITMVIACGIAAALFALVAFNHRTKKHGAPINV
jgi:MFS family permease